MFPTPLASPNQIDEAAAILRRGGAGIVLLLGGEALPARAWRWPTASPPRPAAG